MSRTNHKLPDWTSAPRSIPGRARGGSKERRLLGRSVRRSLNLAVRDDEPQLYQPKKLQNFWWGYW